MMERISLLLSEALTPYHVQVTPCAANAKCLVTLRNGDGAHVLERVFHLSQFGDRRALTDVADGLYRDVRVAEGRLEPSMIAALKSVGLASHFSVGLR